MSKFSLISMLAVLLGTSPVFSAENQLKVLSSPASDQSHLVAEPTQSLESYLHNAYDTSKLIVEKSVVSDKLCGDAYFLSVKVPSFWNSVQVEMEYYVQTMTQESQDRLYDSISKNLATKGLPKCLLQDQFYAPTANFPIAYIYNYNPDFTTVSISAKMQDIPPGQLCSGKAQRQFTTCWNIQDPYAN